MKLFKKLAAAGLAAVSAVSVFTLTACGNEGGYGDEKSAAEATQVIENLNKVKTDAIALSGNIKMFGIDVDVDGKINTSGAFDVACKMNGDDKQSYGYLFMRNWGIYGVESETEVTDFSAATFAPIANLGDYIGDQSSAVTLVMPAMVNMLVSASNYTMLSLGKVTDSVSFKNNTLTVDYNLATYNMINDFKGVIDGLTPATTVGDVLGNATVKKYAQIFTELVTYNDLVTVVTMLKAMLESQGNPSLPMPMAEIGADDEIIEPVYPDEGEIMEIATVLVDVLDTLLNSVKPDANSSTYDYLVKLISSDELKNVINEIIGATDPDAVLVKNLSQYSIKDMLSLAMEEELTDEQVNVMLATVKTQVTEAVKGVTAESITLVQENVTIVETGVKYTFTYDKEYVLSSQGVSGKVSVTDSTDAANNLNVEIDLKVEYSANAFTLATLPATLPAFPEIVG